MKICIATGTRAEYGLLKRLMDLIRSEAGMELQLLVTGAHLSPEFGLTVKQIEADGFSIDAAVEMLLSSDTDEGIVKSMGLGMIGFADAFGRLRPDLLIILGDRYEMLSVASAALIFKIPIAHLHGGEITEGAYDDAIRHSITKMSHLHFASTETHRNRIIQMGEHPDNVWNVGAIGIDNIMDLELLDKPNLENELQIKFKKYNFLVAFHPETLAMQPVETQFSNLLSAIELQQDSFFIFTMANADTNGRIINAMMKDYVTKNPDKAALFASLGTMRFLSMMKFVDAIVGNSSSAIVEAPSLNTMTINIGERQKGRVQAASILNCQADYDEILQCFTKVRELIQRPRPIVVNPYGNGGTAQKIMEVLRGADPKEFRTKTFYS